MIWTLFHRSPNASQRPHHVLCHGFQRASSDCLSHEPDSVNIPGIVCQHPNENVRTLKAAPWTDILALLGRDGHCIIRALLLDCGIFVHLSAGKDNFYQLSGIPLSDLESRTTLEASRRVQTQTTSLTPVRGKEQRRVVHNANDIVLVRNRILYARPSLNSQAEVRFGLKHIHALNRFPNATNPDHATHVMKYIFPRQFGLHNVFTSEVDPKETVQPFKDYTLREYEVSNMTSNPTLSRLGAESPKRSKTGAIPRRLRGRTQQLVKKLLTKHGRCSYTQLLRHYCPLSSPSLRAISCQKNGQSLWSEKSSGPLVTQSSLKMSIGTMLPATSTMQSAENAPATLVDYATSHSAVSSFCQSVVTKLLPEDALGRGAAGEQNTRSLMASVDRFVRMRRFESLSLHQITQGLKISCIPWLCPDKVTLDANLSQSDFEKRKELFLELVYYVFDSILIPLIRSNFYVTESNVHRNRLFYFRHDVWRRLSEPALDTLKLSMYEELKPCVARKLLDSRKLGYGQIRLLPKVNGVRPIINLRKRAMRRLKGRSFFEKSINAQLSPVFDMLNFERWHQNQKLGSALFSVGELHGRLKQFKAGIEPVGSTKIYFVKVDIQSCFDTIPQIQLLRMVKTLISKERYRMSKHAEVKRADARWTTTKAKAIRRFVGSARPLDGTAAVSATRANAMASTKRRTVFTDIGNQRVWESRQLLHLLQEHISRNVVKAGKRYFRQKSGIPQGSILSSLLCSFFYGAFEQERLDFLHRAHSLLLRLIDDFLLITMEESQAREFLEVMGPGSPEHGISINASKSLANFEVSVNGSKIPRHHGSVHFPYCGISIDIRTLELSKDRSRADLQVANALSVEFSRKTGQVFHRRVMGAFKIQMHAMLLDTSLNSRALVMSSLYQNFAETGIKMYRYVKSLPRQRKPTERMMIRTIEDLIGLAINLTRGKRRTKTVEEYQCALSRGQIHWLASMAMERVIRQKQTAYPQVLQWLDCMIEIHRRGMKLTEKGLGHIVEEGARAFDSYQF